jgi:hypothetical protein
VCRRWLLLRPFGYGLGGVGCWDGSVDEKSLQLLKVMREQLKETMGRAVDAGPRRRGLACTPKPSTAACSIWSGPDT